MLVRAKMGARFFLPAAFASMLLAAGCFTSLTVDRAVPPAVDLRDYQPVAILSPADAAGFAGSGSLLARMGQESLKAKNFVVIPPEKSAQVLQDLDLNPREVSRNVGLLRRFGAALNSRIVLVAAFLDYRTQKSYISSSTSQVWQGAVYEYQSLPTYHQGICEMKISLKMLDSENGTLVWVAEGRGRGPSGSEERILRRLVEDLTKDLPPLPEKRR